ncbi:MAG: hypothetical protein WBA44_00780 [Mesorhizobium sp.]
MTITETALIYLTDPFRIGLLVALVITTLRTSAQTGKLIPLALGAVFVAILLPSTMGEVRTDRQTAIVGGFIANVIILAVLMALLEIWNRLNARSEK